MRCELGTVLHALPGLQPRFDEPFVIIDERLSLQAVSRRAESVLRVEEPAAVDVPLEEFLIADDGDPEHTHLRRLIAHAIAGSTRASTLKLHTVSDPQIGFVARIAGCGPPQAALVVLTPLGTSRQRERTGATAIKRRVGTVGAGKGSR
jgi:hypothetical protein